MSNALKEFDALIGSLAGRKHRLSFPERCAAYGALRRGFPQADTARAFGLSRSSISVLNNARASGADRYQDVVSEYDRMGHDDFCAHYLTEELISKIMRFHLGLETESDQVRPRGVDPASATFAWRLFPIEQSNGNIVQAFVGLRNTGQDIDINHPEHYLPAGWAWREAVEWEIAHNCYQPQAESRWSDSREFFSSKALNRAFTDYGQDPPSIEFRQRVAGTKKMDNTP